MVDTIMEICNVIVRHNVPLTVDLNGHVRLGRSGIFREFLPGLSCPPHKDVRVMSADKHIVSDIKILRSGIIGMNAYTDIFKTAFLNGESAGAGYVLFTCLNSNICVAKGYALKVVVISSFEVKKGVTAIAVEDDFTIACGFYRNRLLCCAAPG